MPIAIATDQTRPNMMLQTDTKTPLSPEISKDHDQKKPLPQTRRVHFLPVVKSMRYLHHNDFTDHEYYSCWYSDEERQVMKVDHKEMFQLLKRGGPLPPNFTFRGLEHRTREGAKIRQGHKKEGWAAVLIEQNRQLQDDVKDPEMIRLMYRRVAQHCQESAVQKGIQDAEEVSAIERNLPDCLDIWGAQAANI